MARNMAAGFLNLRNRFCNSRRPIESYYSCLAHFRMDHSSPRDARMGPAGSSYGICTIYTAGGPDVSGEDDFGVPHVSRLHVGLRLTGAGLDFPLSPDPCARPPLCPIPKHQNSINVLTTSIICPIIACEYLPDHRFTGSPSQHRPSSELPDLLNFPYLLYLQSLAHS